MSEARKQLAISILERLKIPHTDWPADMYLTSDMIDSLIAAQAAPLKLFVWYGIETLARYADGMVVVMAETREAAIDIAVTEFIAQRSSWWQDDPELIEKAAALRTELNISEYHVSATAMAVIMEGSE